MKVSVIGGGTIGTAVAIALRGGGHEVVVTRRSTGKIEGLTGKGISVSNDNMDAINKTGITVISLKPLDAIAVLKELKDLLKGRVVISMAAALRISKISSILTESKVVRAMTNIAARVGGGYTVYSYDHLDAEDEKAVSHLLGCLGESERVEEKYMDALTAMSGSGPAYIFTVIESMVYAGLKVGLPRELALRSSYQTVLGSAKLVATGENHISELRDLVTTPGGVTIDALYELESAGIRTAFMRAIEAATEKAKKISDTLEKV